MDPGREAYLGFAARCEQSFKPFAPMNLPDFFAGRREHVDRLSSELAKPRRHVAIYGERGVGRA